MTKSEASFLNEVAAELVSRGVENPTVEQIADAMETRIARQWALFAKLYPNGLYQRSDAAREVLAEMASAVYQEVRNA
jgi:hypothetical protein